MAGPNKERCPACYYWDEENIQNTAVNEKRDHQNAQHKSLCRIKMAPEGGFKRVFDTDWCGEFVDRDRSPKLKTWQCSGCTAAERALEEIEKLFFSTPNPLSPAHDQNGKVNWKKQREKTAALRERFVEIVRPLQGAPGTPAEDAPPPQGPYR